MTLLGLTQVHVMTKSYEQNIGWFGYPTTLIITNKKEFIRLQGNDFKYSPYSYEHYFLGYWNFRVGSLRIGRRNRDGLVSKYVE